MHKIEIGLLGEKFTFSADEVTAKKLLAAMDERKKTQDKVNEACAVLEAAGIGPEWLYKIQLTELKLEGISVEGPEVIAWRDRKTEKPTVIKAFTTVIDAHGTEATGYQR